MRFVRRVPLGHNHDFVLWKAASATEEAGPPSFSDLADNWNDPSSNLLRNPRATLVQSLIESQGHLCAWTGLRIDIDSAHIDHIVPQTRERTLDLEIDNLVAAFPKSGADASYGTHIRGDAWDPEMVRPNRSDCEHRLVYFPSGKVAARTSTDESAVDTINWLKLDHAALVEARRAAVRGFKARTTFVADFALLEAKSNRTSQENLIDSLPQS